MAPKFGSARSPKISLGVGAVLEQRYRLEEEIGRGGMGIVYRAQDLATAREVAVKVINLNEAIPGAREKFLREARITLQLKHPNIVAVHSMGAVDTGTGEPSPFIVMELVRGKNLEQLRDLTIAQVIDLGKQICDALEYAHAQGFVHRDLKPENILIEPKGFGYAAKLADFGLARPSEISGSMGERIEGTVYYLAPEVIAGQPADVAADLYALGAMLYQMVTGRVPFSDFDAQTILTQHSEERVIPPSESRDGVPPALEAIILRLLAKNPRDRFASAREVGEALDAIAGKAERNDASQQLPVNSIDVSDQDQVAHVKQLLESNRLVTLLGEGSGKTLLALATGAKLIEEFSDGIWLIELGAVQDPAAVPMRVAAVLGVKESPDRTLIRSLMEYLGEKELLFILDRCDHLLGACAQFTETILQTCPQVRILATSRLPLNIATEECFQAPG